MSLKIQYEASNGCEYEITVEYNITDAGFYHLGQYFPGDSIEDININPDENLPGWLVDEIESDVNFMNRIEEKILEAA